MAERVGKILARKVRDTATGGGVDKEEGEFGVRATGQFYVLEG